MAEEPSTLNGHHAPSVLYEVQGKIAHITLNRPHALNAIDDTMPALLEQAVQRANADVRVHVIVVSGAGRSFCSGYDLKVWAETKGPNAGQQEMPWDPLVDYQMMNANTRNFMSLWYSLKPVICKVRGFAVAGGSDIALCCVSSEPSPPKDLIIMAEDAKIGYPPARVWGCPTTFMWVYRLGAERAKRMLLTGDLIDGKEAAHIGLITKAVPEDQLDQVVDKLAQRMASVPKNQLMMQKLVVNSAYENMGLRTTQTLATLMDGIARHTPEGVAFKRMAEKVGFKRAVLERDTGSDISKAMSAFTSPSADATSTSSPAIKASL